MKHSHTAQPKTTDRATAASLVIALTLSIWLTACSTSSGTRWAERVGTYGVEEAKAELGKPDITEDLPNGWVRATWITRTTSHDPSRLHTGSSYDPRTDNVTGVEFSSTAPTTKESQLTLIFDEDGLLKEWEN